ncbi:hypothetical protein ACNHYB_05280 [Isoptericola jiangsuensis]
MTTVERAEVTVRTHDGVQEIPPGSFTLRATLWHDGSRWYVVTLAEST